MGAWVSSSILGSPTKQKGKNVAHKCPECNGEMHRRAIRWVREDAEMPDVAPGTYHICHCPRCRRTYHIKVDEGATAGRTA